MDTHSQPIAPVTRDWRPLCGALAFLQTRSIEFATEVGQDPGCRNGIALRIAVRLAARAHYDRQPLRTIESFEGAWLRLRAWIEDGKIAARGTALDRYSLGPNSAHDVVHIHGVLPSEQASGLIPWDEPSSGETWLRPSDPAIFGQGRHWKSVEIYWPALMNIAVQTSKGPKNRGGRRSGFDWHQIEQEVFCHFDNEGGADLLATVEQFIADLILTRHARTLSESYIREHAQKVWIRLQERGR